MPELLSVGSARAASAEEVQSAVAPSSPIRITELGDGAWLVNLAPAPLERVSNRVSVGEPQPAARQRSTPSDEPSSAVDAEAMLVRQRESLARALRDPLVDWAYPAYRVPSSGALLYPTPRIIVGVAEGIDARRLAELLPGSVRIRRPLRGERQYLLELTSPRADDPLAVAASLVVGFSWVRWAEPDFMSVIRPHFVPDDALFPNQWHLRNTGQGGGQPGADAQLELAWDVQTGDGSVVIAVLDDGVQLDHPDLPIFTNPGEVLDGTPTRRAALPFATTTSRSPCRAIWARPARTLGLVAPGAIRASRYKTASSPTRRISAK